VDNLQLYSKTIPPQLKQKGFGAYPNPFGDFVTVWHLYPPKGLLGASLVDVAGRRMAQWQWKAGTAPQTLRIPTSAYAAGIYTLVLQYDSKREVVRLLKMHNP
jgi:hypothetical protein